MAFRNPVYVEQLAGHAIRIFKNLKIAVQAGCAVFQMERADAVRQIRHAVFVKANFACEHCATPVMWDPAQLHERLWRGRGGEVSVANGVCLCDTCHHNDPVAGHGKRKVQWSK